ncbi:MAG: hypothetical protein RLZ55_1365 [Actinomycetota bacterium]|jgi:ABC-type cobalamin transport system ATPase subunit
MPGRTAADAKVARAIGRVLDVDPGVVRRDTPLADLGVDAVALLAIVDALRQAGVSVAVDSGDVADTVRRARTAGELMNAVEASASASAIEPGDSAEVSP